MRIVPSSTVTLYKDVDIDVNEQLVFSSKNAQAAYFQSKIASPAVTCQMVRKTGRLRLDKAGSVVAQCNYLSFINPDFDDKIIYCRIVDYDYVNNECVDISYIIDYWQTWMFDVVFEDMYIEREHLSEDDWNKAETNPYDPSILEFRTGESLPVGPDIEKLYYSYGNNNTYDGVYLKEYLCNSRSLVNRNGILLIFSDVNLENADGTTGPGTGSPSDALARLISSLTLQNGSQMNNLCFYRLSNATFKYLNTAYPAIIPYSTSKGSQWGNLDPMEASTLYTPTNYVYIDNDVDGSDVVDTFSEILGWFTDKESLDNILGVYPIPTGMMYFSAALIDGQMGVEVMVPHRTGADQNVVNKKLDLYPYTYYRVIAPNGDTKELRIEDFKDAQDGGSTCNLGVSLDVVEKPNLIVAPVNYKASGAAPNLSGVNFNVKEGLIFTQFPTLPYSIDSFRSQMAAVVNGIIGNNTIDYSYTIQQQQLNIYKQEVEMGKKAVDTAYSAGTGHFIEAGKGVADFALMGAQRDIDAGRYQNEWAMSEDAYKYLAGDKSGAITNNFQYVKPAYVSQNYHQMNGDGVTNFNINSFMDILFLRVSINPTILAQMDTYFSNYGYSSGRCGIPRVINFIHGVSGDANLPHWQTLNNKNTTYIKTVDCRVTHSMLPVAQFIKAMFDTGVRMIKGDLS